MSASQTIPEIHSVTKDGAGEGFRPSANGPAALLAIFAVALGFRLLTLQLYHWPVVTDLYIADQSAINLLSGHGFSASLGEPYVAQVFRTPGYAVFLAILYKVFGHSFVVAQYANGVLDAITALLVALIGTRARNAQFGMLAGFLYALYPYSAALCSMMHQDIILTTVVTFAFWATIRGQEEAESFRWWTLAGLAVGIATLIKPVLLVYGAVPAVAIAACRIEWKKKFAAAAVLAATAGLLVIPWTIRNYIEFQEFPILASGSPDDAGLNTLREELDADRAGLTMKIITGDRSGSRDGYLAQFVDGKPLILETREARRANLQVLESRWPEWMKATLMHIPRLWVTAYSRYDPGWKSYAMSVFSGITLLLGIIGMLLARRRWTPPLLAALLTIAVVTLVYAPLHVEARYTLPARPALILFIGVVLFRMRWLRESLQRFQFAIG